jgi:hypothetical protein
MKLLCHLRVDTANVEFTVREFRLAPLNIEYRAVVGESGFN